MHIGVVFPQTEIPPNAPAIRAWVAAVVELGFHHVVAYDHVLGADPVVHAPWQGFYDIDDTFHEPFVLFGFLAAIAPIELVTGVLVLPQRQTALVAKQAVAVDVLSEGRFRFGVGVGWNDVEYVGLGRSFNDRGHRVDEQIELLRLLWADRSVTFEGVYERVVGAGIAPRPCRRSIPLWLGGRSTATYARIGRCADGWFPQLVPGAALIEALESIGTAAAAAGRDPRSIGMEGKVNWGDGGTDDVARGADAWRVAGASHISINTMGAGLREVEEHVDVLARVAHVLSLKSDGRDDETDAGTKVVFVTGGSRGIGAATACRFAAAGWDVAIGYRSQVDAAAAVLRTIEERGQRALACQGDVADEGDVAGMFGRIDAELGRLDAVVNNAGVVAPPVRLAQMSAEQMARTMAVNVVGPMLCVREAIPRMSRQLGRHGGAIVNVSSGAARHGAGGSFVDYGASKGALETLTVGLARELGGESIRVNGVRPGIIQTEMLADAGDANMFERFRSTIPLGRPGDADEVAAAIVWLCSDEASYVTGAIIDVGGGR